jgi:hypothetical protein
MGTVKIKTNKKLKALVERKYPDIQDSDYYFSTNSVLVFTETHHLKRGYCCKSNCRHCPWQEKKNM